MPKPPTRWTKGRGKLGPLAPLLGSWEAAAESPRGPMRCRRTFEPVLDSAFQYQELAIYGPREGGNLGFWSFTNDGKRSEGVLADVSDLHPGAVGFEARMPAGVARTAYWPDGAGGFHWTVEAKTKKGWKRFTEHDHRRA